MTTSLTLCCTDIQPKDVSLGSGQTRESAVISTADDLLNRIPNSFQKDMVSERLKKLGGTKPMNVSHL